MKFSDLRPIFCHGRPQEPFSKARKGRDNVFMRLKVFLNWAEEFILRQKGRKHQKSPTFAERAKLGRRWVKNWSFRSNFGIVENMIYWTCANFSTKQKVVKGGKPKKCKRAFVIFVLTLSLKILDSKKVRRSHLARICIIKSFKLFHMTGLYIF